MILASWGIAISGILMGIGGVYALKIILNTRSLTGSEESESNESVIKKMAHLGDHDAQYHIGYLYEHGIGLPINLGKSFYWYCRSSEGGHVGAIKKVAQCYIDGKGVPEDLDEGMWWLSESDIALIASKSKAVCLEIEEKFGKTPYAFLADKEFHEKQEG